MLRFLIAFGLSLSISLSLQANVTNYESLLLEKLFDPEKYDARAGPETYNAKGELQTEIKIQFEIMGVIEFDKESSSVTFKAAFRQWWWDPRLTWNVSDYGGVENIWVSTTSDPAVIWHSDIIIREDAGDGYFSNFKDTQIRVRNDGYHYWTRLGDLKVVSSFDFTNYPFDQQTINITVGSWLYQDKRVKFSLQSVPYLLQDVNDWILYNTEWDFMNMSVVPVYLNQTQGFRTYYRYQIILKREGGTVMVAMIIPGCLVAMLGSLYYLLPRGSGARVSYLATILLTEIMFLVMITQFVPQSKIVPKIAYLFLHQTIILACLSFIVLIIDQAQKIRDSRQQDRLLLSKKKLHEVQSRRNTLTQKDAPQYGINPRLSVADSESLEQIQQLIDQEQDTSVKIVEEEQNAMTDKCMNITDLVIFIGQIIAFGTISIINLKAIF